MPAQTPERLDFVRIGLLRHQDHRIVWKGDGLVQGRHAIRDRGRRAGIRVEQALADPDVDAAAFQFVDQRQSGRRSEQCVAVRRAGTTVAIRLPIATEEPRARHGPRTTSSESHRPRWRTSGHSS